MGKIKEIVRKILWRLNATVTRASYHNSIPGLLKRTSAAGIEIKTIFDIGAHNGLWSSSIQKYLNKSNFYLFEPNSVHNQEIIRRGFVPINVLLSDKHKKVKFFRSIGRTDPGTGDSIYPESENEDELLYEIREAKTLDSVVSSLRLPNPDLVKIDVQGAEIDVLKGSKRTIRDCTLILLECPVMRYNKGAPNFDDYCTHLLKSGFVPFHLIETHLFKGMLVQIDLAWMKREVFEERIQSLDASMNFWKLNEV